MVRVARILKDFRETGALNSLIALWGFVDETSFLTKAGAVGVLYRLQGVDFECLDHPQRQTIVHGFEQALRQLDESFRVYQYLIKRPAAVVTAAPHAHPVVEEALRRRTAHFAANATPSSSSSCTWRCSTRAPSRGPPGRVVSVRSPRHPPPRSASTCRCGPSRRSWPTSSPAR